MNRDERVKQLDVTNFPREFDKMIAAASNPRHRQMLEVVRRHYILELCGRMEELFAPDMMVEDPVYYLNLDDSSRTLRGREQVMGFYRQIEGVPLACDNLVHAISDVGYWAECYFHFYLPGTALGLTADAWYIKRQWISMYWPFDKRVRLIGEHVYEHAALREVIEIDPSQVLTTAEMARALTPLLRPIPTYHGS
ncbi:MAG TPA: hypothetical protein VH165_00030 [Kofleriaceae bacterium]|jgi:hypothetical protein|nr:hypothetical protein [Kofleriaceae bacterium]